MMEKSLHIAEDPYGRMTAKSRSNRQNMHGIKKIAIGKDRRTNNRTDNVNETERGALRAGNGRLSWLAEHTRSDVLFDLWRLQSSVDKATVQNLVDYNNLVHKAHKDSDDGLSFVPLKA